MSVKEYLPACFAGMPIFTYDMVDSTNNAAKRYFLDGGILPALFIADGQTAGRGRNGRSFFSPSGAGLYMSLALPINTSPDKAISFTAIAAVAVCKAIEQLTDIRPAIKWVNDIYVSERKVCGILVEAMPDKDGNMAAVIGIGINLTDAGFPDDLRGIACSLNEPELSREELAGAIISRLARYLDGEDWLAEYRGYSMIMGKTVRCIHGNEVFTGKAIAIDERGGLMVEDGKGKIRTLRSGEISLRLAPEE